MYKCIKCKKKYLKKYNFCPKCGGVVEPQNKEKKLLKNVKIKFLIIGIIAAIVLVFVLFKAISAYMSSDDKIYNDAIKAYDEGEFESAIPLFDSVNDVFEDAKYYKSICRYYVALDLIENGEYYDAQQQLDKVISSSLKKIDVSEGQDVDTLSALCCSKIVETGLQAFEQKNYQDAYDYLMYASRKPQYVDITKFKHENNLLGIWYTIRGKWVPTDSKGSDIIQITDSQIIVSSSKLHSGTYDYVLKSITDYYDDFWGYQTYDYISTEDGTIQMQLTGYDRSSSSEFEDTQNGNKIKMYLEGSPYLETQKKIQDFKAEQEKKEPQIGMTQEQVEASAWGKPTRINKTTYRWGVREQWCYSNYRYIYFENGYVTSISE